MTTIPQFSSSGVIPPFVGAAAGNAERSPYRTEMSEVATRFGFTAARRCIIRGFIDLRAELRRVGVREAFQWIDGSFVEKIDREPKDLDVVTFAKLAPSALAIPAPDLALFNPVATRARFLCDAYFISVSPRSPEKLVENATYWYGLFSHRRSTFEWKGIVEVTLDDDAQDANARTVLDMLDASEGGHP
jgi:hypothetical protein